MCRLNSGPVRGFSADVGNRTSIRMSYPEGSPKVWEDMDSDLRFVAVIYKSVDFHWLRAMITKTSVVSTCLRIRQMIVLISAVCLNVTCHLSVAVGLAVFLEECAGESPAQGVSVPSAESRDY